MKLKPALLGLIALVAGTAAQAQLVELLTQAELTVQATYTVPSLDTTSTSRTYSTTTLRLTQQQVIEDLQARELIPAANGSTGWRLFAVQPPAPDLSLVADIFKIYAVSPAGVKYRLPEQVFGADSFFSVENYTERSLGQYVISSKGTINTYYTFSYLPTLNLATSSATRLPVIASSCSGMSTIDYVVKDEADGHEVLFYAVSRFTVSASGSYRFTSAPTPPPAPYTETGLVNLVLTTKAARLVFASDYPDFYDEM
jgi:hypothetical protein